jgi:hypothetical protein
MIGRRTKKCYLENGIGDRKAQLKKNMKVKSPGVLDFYAGTLNNFSCLSCILCSGKVEVLLNLKNQSKHI